MTTSDFLNNIQLVQAYLDDSSDDKKQRICAVGCFYTFSSRWKRFYTSWSAATKDLKSPFRSTDCECGKKQYKDWEKPKRDDLIKTLCGIISDFDLSAFGSAVSVSDYQAIFPNADNNAPYLLCLGMCLANVAEVIELSNKTITQRGFPPVDIHFCVEGRNETEAREKILYDSLRTVEGWSPAKRMSGLSHSGKEAVGLQAADLIARETFKFYDNRHKRPTRKPVLALANQITFHAWTKENLSEMAALMQHHSQAKVLTMFARKMTVSHTERVPLQ